jgi:23S rRNA pseudouridine1911/1915/1917 synthase
MKMTISEIYDGRFGEILMREYLPKIGLSRRIIIAAKPDGLFLNGQRVTVRAGIKSGDRIDIVIPDTQSENIEPIALDLRVIYEDDDILAVYKPTNMPTHPSRGNSLPTLANGVMAMYSGNFVFRAITRLDRDTAGIVLIAKNPISAAKLSALMKRGEIRKTYVARLSAMPKDRRGVIDAPIRRESEGSIKRIVAPDGKRAVTEYEVIEQTPDGCICRFSPLTGRTHQIRVHAAHIGCPLKDDFLYGERGEFTYDLRCIRLEFIHPKSNEIIVIEA